jgi:hypothetical protein
MILLCGAPTSIFAQRGGHGGGGGFHGVSGHSTYGGGYYGGYHGGGYGWHGGYGWSGGYGWRGGYWGYPRYGYGWGFGIGFSWGPYWPAYPYAYGYGPWSGAPYNYYPCAYPYYAPSSCSPPYSYPYNGSSGGSVEDPRWNGNENSLAKPSRGPTPATSPNAASVINVAASTRTASTYMTDADTGATHYRLAFTMQELPPARKEVQNVILALRAMPPDARRMQIDSGRYRSFSPEEIELLRSSSHIPTTW